MNNSDQLMLKNIISIGVAFHEAHGNFAALMTDDVTLTDFLEICANNHINLKAFYNGVKDND